MATFARLRRVYDFYTSGLSYKDVEKLLHQDVPEVYDFYTQKIKSKQPEKRNLRGTLRFLRDIFVEFLNQLTPIRRLAYSFAFLLFVFSVLASNWNWAVFSFIILNLLIAFELADKITAKSELEVAREIQNNLMPKNAPSNGKYEISCISKPAREVGGDYYDFIIRESSPEKTYIIIGDISGKGMAAALHMVQVQSVLNYLVLHYSSPKEILSALNKHLKKVLTKGSFFTVSIASLDSRGEMSLVRAGHMPLIHFCKGSGECKNITPKGMGIGLTNDIIFDNSLEEVFLKPEAGDILVFYTDGIVEAMNAFNNEYGEERLKNVIRKYAYKSSAGIQEEILYNIETYIGSSPAHDDLTLIIMKFV